MRGTPRNAAEPRSHHAGHDQHPRTAAPFRAFRRRRELRQLLEARAPKYSRRLSPCRPPRQRVEHLPVGRVQGPVRALAERPCPRTGAEPGFAASPPHALPAMTPATTSHTAAMAAARVLDLRHTAPDGACRRRLAELADGEAALRAVRGLHRQFGQQA